MLQKKCTHLTRGERSGLLKLLTKFEELFDGTLGDWKTSPVHVSLKDGFMPYRGKAYPVPKIHRDCLYKEVKDQKNWGY